VVGATDPQNRILGFLDRNRYFSFKQLLSCTQEAEWTPFQTHHFSEHLVAPEIEHGTLATRPRRRSDACSIGNNKLHFYLVS
jgi:hypothetical protein